MKIQKILNNNVVVVKELNEEKIIMGAGIGFQRKKNDPVDQSKIEKIFVMTDPNEKRKFKGMIEMLPAEHFQISEEIISYAEKELGIRMNEHFHISFSDHLSFAIERLNKGMIIKNSLLNEIQILYPKEYQIGIWAQTYLRDKYGIHIPDDEAGYIALHMHSARNNTGNIQKTLDSTNLLQDITKIIEQYFQIQMDKKSISYERLISHLLISIQSLEIGDPIHELDNGFLQMVKKHYQEAFKCAHKIEEFVKDEYGLDFPEMDLAYISIHIQRYYRRAIAN